jgi:hypothetical protein
MTSVISACAATDSTARAMESSSLRPGMIAETIILLWKLVLRTRSVG